MITHNPHYSMRRFSQDDRHQALAGHNLLLAHPLVEFRKGEAIFADGAAAPFVYIVVKGYVKLVSYTNDREVLEDYYQAGDIFHTAQLFGQEPKQYAASAMSRHAVVRKVPALAFRQYIQQDQVLLNLTIQCIGEALERTRDRLRRLAVLHSNDRIVDFLTTFAQQSGRCIGYEWVIYAIPTHGDIGLITGTSRQTVTTVLNGLRRTGLIDFNRKNMIIRDMRTLAAHRFND